MVAFLRDGQVDIWSFELNHPHWGDLSEEELLHSQSFHQREHQIQYASGRSILKAILNQYVDLPPLNRVIFDKNEFGKLYLKAYPFLQFNLTHARNKALVIVGHEHPVGIDLEYHQPVKIFELSELLYSTDEIEVLKNLPYYMQSLSFFNFWTKKEAFIKAIGMGLSYPTKEFTTTMGYRVMQPIQDRLFQSEWQLFSWMPEINYSASVCVNPSIQTLSIQPFSI